MTQTISQHDQQQHKLVQTSSASSTSSYKRLNLLQCRDITSSPELTTRTTSTDQGITCDIIGPDWLKIISDYEGKCDNLLDRLDGLQELISQLEEESQEAQSIIISREDQIEEHTQRIESITKRLEDAETCRETLEKQLQQSIEQFLDMEQMVEHTRKELLATTTVYQKSRQENQSLKQKCHVLKKRVKESKRQRKWQVERLRKIQHDMTRLSFLEDHSNSTSSDTAGGTTGGGLPAEYDMGDAPSSQYLDWNYITDTLRSLKYELADLESVVTSTTCTELGEHEVHDYQHEGFGGFSKQHSLGDCE